MMQAVLLMLIALAGPLPIAFGILLYGLLT